MTRLFVTTHRCFRCMLLRYRYGLYLRSNCVMKPFGSSEVWSSLYLSWEYFGYFHGVLWDWGVGYHNTAGWFARFAYPVSESGILIRLDRWVWYRTRVALASILGPFLLHLLKFTLVTPFLHTFFFSLLLLSSYPGSLMHYLGSILLEFPVGICDALHITTHEYDCDLITGFPFALVFTCTFTECVT